MDFDPGPGIRYGATGNQNGEIALWDLTNGKLRGVLDAHPVGVRKLVFSPGGEFLASVGEDNTMKVWKLGNQSK
jgi:WD40 repeat protein